MNRLHDALVGDGSQDALIQTANAGEHAMSINLAMKLYCATGYAVEPFQLVNAWEQFGVSALDAATTIRVLQIETRNPYFHDSSKGNGHIQQTQVQGLSTIYYSKLTPRKLKDDLEMSMKEEFPTLVDTKGEPERPRTYPPLDTMDFAIFRTKLGARAHTMHATQDFTFRFTSA
jgi:mannosyl-3-phosphoglycerate synthase